MISYIFSKCDYLNLVLYIQLRWDYCYHSHKIRIARNAYNFGIMIILRERGNIVILKIKIQAACITVQIEQYTW